MFYLNLFYTHIILLHKMFNIYLFELNALMIVEQLPNYLFIILLKTKILSFNRLDTFLFLFYLIILILQTKDYNLYLNNEGLLI